MLTAQECRDRIMTQEDLERKKAEEEKQAESRRAEALETAKAAVMDKIRSRVDDGFTNFETSFYNADAQYMEAIGYGGTIKSWLGSLGFDVTRSVSLRQITITISWGRNP